MLNDGHSHLYYIGPLVYHHRQFQQCVDKYRTEIIEESLWYNLECIYIDHTNANLDLSYLNCYILLFSMKVDLPCNF